MSEILKNRTELLFLYEIENANPNGDPLNENRPRFDTEDDTVIVSDVRLKRTIRDYWYEYKGYNGKDGKDIFVRETEYQDGDKTYISDGKRRATAFQENKDTVLKTCIDIRVFGGVLPLPKDSITLTGPTQFQMGRSLHKTEIITEQGTGAFASGDKKGQATFRTEYKVPYCLIGFNGIINEKAANYSTMSEADKELLLDGIWQGTKNLISRSKFGQNPVLLLAINYKEDKPYYIGSLRQRVKLQSDKNDKAIRGLEDFSLDFSDVIAEIKANLENIESVEIKADARLKFVQPLTIADGKLDLTTL
ncbi:type I-B CRISPR-associated protein Cas7/Csh2 [Flectobacillus sp. BAB-3569]|uniref:type I-B CRISPR-associated protein Cas7/Csh2 n=1 Tax=Flectobacillus sp. BAB-3569 TaxID=1509483 RepID=UPI000BA3D7F1|nr:type I-B CRISPR-associated protein Cas7/Csh2 [Flectobacillus sp. BAB-3569]PAC26478.1 type I-B CRISPR-associated protein Cas7/Csh2 [Flectobacillus sp. BAB-3569]